MYFSLPQLKKLWAKERFNIGDRLIPLERFHPDGEAQGGQPLSRHYRHTQGVPLRIVIAGLTRNPLLSEL
jgi:hypothetical protein